MIVGTGTDLVDMKRIEALLSRHGERFIRRCFTETERTTAEIRREGGLHVAAYAKRWAAKEAFAKALGTGFRDGIYLKDIGVINDESGKPSFALTGGAAQALASLIPAGQRPAIHLSLSDEPPIAKATVIIEAL